MLIKARILTDRLPVSVCVISKFADLQNQLCLCAQCRVPEPASVGRHANGEEIISRLRNSFGNVITQSRYSLVAVSEQIFSGLASNGALIHEPVGR